MCRPRSCRCFTCEHTKAPTENEERLHKRIFYARQTVRNCAGTFERMRQSTVRLVQTYLDSGGHFGHLLRTVNRHTTKSQQLLHWDRAL